MNARWFVVFAMLMFLLFGFAVFAQSTNDVSAEQTVFASPDGVFRFSYPRPFLLCTTDMEPCTRSIIPVCSHDALVCVVYPSDAFKGTNFRSAAFQVRLISDKPPFSSINSADLCATPRPVLNAEGKAELYTEFLISAEHPSELINGLRFVHGVSGGAASSTSISSDVYRAFRNGKCYELGIARSVSNYEVYAPGTIKKFTDSDTKQVEAELSTILHSFRFLN